MYRTILATTAFLVSGGSAFAEAPPDEMVKKLTATVRKHCPDATVEVTNEGFVAKFGTMTFTVHGRGKSGEIFAQTHQQEGPNFKGFLLHVSLRDGKYEGAAVVPQTLQGPYFPTYIDAAAVEKQDKHYFVSFSYGSRLDPDLKKAILETIPQTGFRKGAEPNRGGR
jgi:hypothetical protein